MPVKRRPPSESAIYLLPHGGRMLVLTDDDRRRFRSKLVGTEHGCVVWQGKPNRQGYGVLWLPKYKLGVLAHRAAWVFNGGEITADKPFVMNACPQCDMACCEPGHLRAGSSDEERQCVWRKRAKRHEPTTKAKPQQAVPRDDVKLLGLKRRPTNAAVIGRKPRPRYRRTCRELREARTAVWLAKVHEREMLKLERKREREAREQRRRERQDRREVLGW